MKNKNKNKKLILLTMLMALSLNTFATGKGSDGENGNGRLSTHLSNTKDLTVYDKMGAAKKIRWIKNKFGSSGKEKNFLFCRNSNFQGSANQFAKQIPIAFTYANNVSYTHYSKMLVSRQAIYIGSLERISKKKVCFNSKLKVSKRELEQEINNNFSKVTERVSTYHDQLTQLFDGQNFYEEYSTRMEYSEIIKNFNKQVQQDLNGSSAVHFVSSVIDDLKGYIYIDNFAAVVGLQASRFSDYTASLDADLINRLVKKHPLDLFNNALSEFNVYVERTSRYLPRTQGWDTSLAEMRTAWLQSDIRSFYINLSAETMEIRTRVNEALARGETITLPEQDLFLYNHFHKVEKLVETYGLN